MIILNGTENCTDQMLTKKDNLPPTPAATTHTPSIHGQKAQIICGMRTVCSLPQSVQENNSVTPKMQETQGMDKLF